MKKLVISGGPSSGKSSLVDELRNRGYYIVPESALQMIQHAEQTGSNIYPWTNFIEFQKRVIFLQKKQESEIPLETKLAILDRSLADTLAYHRHGEIAVPFSLLRDVKKANYDKVLFVEMLPEKYFHLTKSRKPRTQTQTYANALRVHELLRKTYAALRIPIISIPVIMPVEKRADYVEDLLAGELR